MLLIYLILFSVGCWTFCFASGQVMQLFFPAMLGDEPLLPTYYQQHRKYIIKSALAGYLTTLFFWTAIYLC